MQTSLKMKIEQIYIPHLLKMPEQRQEIILDDQISGLQTLTPIRGNFSITHKGTFLDLRLTVDTILTLTCDRCLQTYNHRLAVQTSEIVWLDYNKDQDLNIPLERQILQEDLCESLAPNSNFAVEEWIYEQLSLAMPLRQLCGNNCQAPIKNDQNQENSIDNRWSALASLKSLIQE
jgi:uncharacterized protein